MNTLVGAKKQRPPGTLWAITSFFNFTGYQTKKENYRIFRQALAAQGVRLIAVEAALLGMKWELEKCDADILVQRRTASVVWQKERLLNIALSYLPQDCDKVVWLDADAVFANQQWAEHTSELLEQYRVVQPYAEVRRLGRGTQIPHDPSQPHDSEEIYPGTVCMQKNPAFAKKVNGAPGLAMAFRRDVLERVPLFDRMILGGADGVMIGAYTGVPLENIDHITYMPPPLRRDAEHWSQKAWKIVRGNVAFVPGVAYALWHGDRAKRGYTERQWLLESFDPARDIRVDTTGCWEWTDEASTSLKQRIRQYFLMRQEDGNDIHDACEQLHKKAICRSVTRVQLQALAAECKKDTPMRRKIVHRWRTWMHHRLCDKQSRCPSKLHCN